jgi:hypothetical protein
MTESVKTSPPCKVIRIFFLIINKLSSSLIFQLLYLKLVCFNEAMTLSITTLGIMTFSIKGFCDTQHNNTLLYAERHYSECRISYIVLLNVIMLSVIMQNIIIKYKML